LQKTILFKEGRKRVGKQKKGEIDAGKPPLIPLLLKGEALCPA